MNVKLSAIFILLIAQVSLAQQHFTLTPEGFVAQDKSDYVVIEKPGKTQKELYLSVLNTLNTMYKDPKEVLSLIEGESITVKGYEENAIVHRARPDIISIGKPSYNYDVSYSITFQFKDGKIRVNRPDFECRRWWENFGSWGSLPLLGKNGFSIFNSNKRKYGEIRSQESYNGLIKYFNDLINNIIQKSETVNDW
ncbi:DUF4468 domain-containing protein [Sinomicrobium sp.]